MAQIRLRIVGESVIEVGGKRITPTSPQLFAVLLYLGMEHDREVLRLELIELLYPQAAGDSAHRLRQLLYKLRGMGAPLIFTDRAVKVEATRIHSDAAELLSGPWELRRDRMVRSFEVLPRYAPADDTPLSGWVEQLREKLHNALRQQLTRDIEVARRKADWRYVEAIARRTLELDPLNESAVLALAEATARTGSKARAISILDAYRAELGEERANLALPATLLQKRIDATRERDTSTRREPLPLIGRERELASLLSEWESARQGNAHLIWLTGHKSVGKTRLAKELASSIRMAGAARIVTFSMSPMDVDRPLSLFAALADRLSALPGAAGCDPQSLRALGKLSGSILLPSAVNADNANSAYSDAAIRNAICDLITCVSEEHPVLVIADDSQHLDESSVNLLNVVLKRLADKRLLVVLTSISERSPELPASTLHLEAMPAEASRELWLALLCSQDAALPEEITRKCLDAAAGNPGYLELLAQQVVQDPEQFSIPSDLITLTDKRLAQLPAQARFVLEAIVTLDDVATATSVAFLSGLPTYDLITALHALEAGNLIVKSQLGLRCRSNLIAERVRATSSAASTSVMEWRAAEYLESEQSSDRWSPSTAWRIASHWQKAGEHRRARAYLRACWQHSVSIGQPARASRAIKEALANTSALEERASLLDDLIGTLQASADLRAVISVVSERRSLSSRVHDTPGRVAQLAFDEDEASLLKNSNPAAHIAPFRAHLESSLLNPQRRIRAARILMMAADLDLDRALADQTIRSCRKIIPDGPYSHLLLSHVSLIYHTIFGDADEALRIADDIQEQTKSLERSWYTAMSDRNCGFARQLAAPGKSDYTSFIRAFTQAVDASMIPVALGHAGSLMSVFIDDGDLAGAETWMASAEKLAESVDQTDYAIDYLGAQVDLALLSGRLRKAREYMDIMERCAPRYQATRSRNELYIYRLRVGQFCGDFSSPEKHVQRLLDYHDIGKTLTRHDDHMEVLWQTLSVAGESERASELLEEYLTCYRRERRPVRYVLRLRTRSDPAWARITPSSGAAAMEAV